MKPALRILGIVAGCLALGFILALATSSNATYTQHFRPTASHIQLDKVLCTHTYDGSEGGNSGEVDWDSNSCNDQIRVRLGCDSRFMGGKYAYGGYVRGIDPIQSGQTCGSGYVLVEVWAQIRTGPGGSLFTCEEWPTQHCGGVLVRYRIAHKESFQLAA